MAPITTIEHLGQYDGQEVTLRGWLYNLRESGKLLFPIFRDGTGQVQGVMFKKAVSEELFESVKSLTQESSVIVTGKVRAEKRAPGGFELDLLNVEVVQRVPEDSPYPISLKDHGVEFLMEHRHLWLRSPRQVAILRIRSEIERAMHDFFYEHDFTRADPPILTPAACEGTSTLFPVDYFDDQAYLTQSGQLYMEAAAMALGKVYSFGPTFRAEKSKTRRHLTEFWMVEPEVAYATLDDIMKLAEEFISFIVARVLETRRHELGVLGRDVALLAQIERHADETNLLLHDVGKRCGNADHRGFHFVACFAACFIAHGHVSWNDTRLSLALIAVGRSSVQPLRPKGESLRIHLVQHARERNCLPHMVELADPGHGALQAHAEAGVRHAAVLAQIQVPLEGVFRQFVLVDALQQFGVVAHALRSADDFAVALRGQHVHAQGLRQVVGVGLHVKGLHRRRITMNHHGAVKFG